MIRELKFRAWDASTSEMVKHENLAVVAGEGAYIVESNEGSLVSSFRGNCLIVMQYTGLQDSEGTDIYEGDVLSGSYGIPPVGIRAPVEFHAGAFYAITSGHNPSICLLSEFIEHIAPTVRGNIHGSPELVEQTDA